MDTLLCCWLALIWFLQANYLQELCSSLMFHLGRTGRHSEAFSVYNMLRYSKRAMSKALHEKILHILIDGRLFRDAYVVVKVWCVVEWNLGSVPCQV